MFNKETDRLSYSSLTRLIKEGVQGFLNPVYKRNNALEKGSIIDKVVFGEPITETVIDISIPKPQIKAIIEMIFTQDYDFNPSLENLEKVCTELDVKSKNFTKIQQTVLEYPDYIEYVKNPRGKFLKPNYDLGINIGNNILLDREANFLFSKGKAQFEWSFVYKGFNMFIKADYLKVDHERQEIIITDLKSSSYPPKFPDSIQKYYYHLQGALYTKAVEDWMEKNDLSHYVLKTFHWVVCNSTKVDSILIYPLSYKDEMEGKRILEETLDKIDKYIANNWQETPEEDTLTFF
jgi:hypothetical protein